MATVSNSAACCCCAAAVLRATRQSNCKWIGEPCKLLWYVKLHPSSWQRGACCTYSCSCAYWWVMWCVVAQPSSELRLPNYRRPVLAIDNWAWSEPRASDLCSGPFKVRGGSINKLSPGSLNGHGSQWPLLLPWNWAVIELHGTALGILGSSFFFSLFFGHLAIYCTTFHN